MSLGNKFKFTPEMVQERRLRPIFDLIDSGNNKKALAEVDKLLKKTSKYTLAKTLKALALVRMNREEEAKFILQQVMAEPESRTIGDVSQILLVCYKELHELQTVCNILEVLRAQLKSEDSEELLVQCFFAQTRVQDHKKMHQTALTLYKTFDKPIYFCWTITSLVLHHGNYIGPLDYCATLSLEVAERMIDKFLLQQRLKNIEFEGKLPLMDLYMQFLVRQAKWAKILDILKSLKYPPEDLSHWSFDNNHEYYCTSMERLDRRQLFHQLKSTFMAHQGEYGLIKQLVDLFGKSNSDLLSPLNEFLKDLRKNRPSFVVALGDLYFLTFTQLAEKERKPRFEQDLEMVIDFGLHKSCFFPDAVNYIHLVESGTQLKLLDLMAEAAATFDLERINLSVSTTREVSKDLNYELSRRDIMGKTFDRYARVKQANLCVGKYIRVQLHRDNLRVEAESTTATTTNSKKSQTATASLVEISENANSNELEKLGSQEKEIDFIDQYIMIAASILLSEHCKLVGKPDSNSDVNLQDKLVTAAICLMEHGLERSPQNPTMRFMLGNAYARVGAVREMLKIMHEIDIKHVQYDTLGYIMFPVVSTSGAYPDCLMMLRQAELMYSSFHVDSMEYVIAAYNNFTFNKVNEFIMFREQLLQSTQCGIVLVERRLLECLAFINSSHMLIKFAAEHEPVFQELLKISCSDNRDLGVLQNLFDDGVNWDTFREATAAMDCLWYKIRLNLLSILVKVITLGLKSNVDEQDSNTLAELEQNMISHKELCTKWKELGTVWDKRKKSIDTHFYGVYPAAYSRPFTLSCPVFMLDQLKCVLKIIKERVADSNFGNGIKYIREFHDVLRQHDQKLQEVLDKNFSLFRQDQKVFRVEKLIKDAHCVLEMFSISRIFIAVAINIGKSSLQAKGKTKGVQKNKSALMSFVNEVQERYEKLHKSIYDFYHFLEEHPLPSWPNEQDCSAFGANYEIDQICEVVTITHDTVQANIRESHLIQLEGILKAATNLNEHIQSFNLCNKGTE